MLFLAGILHDLGLLVIYQQNPTLAAAVSRQIENTHQLRDQAEREVLGFDHAEVGAMLIDAWSLPRELTELVRCHHPYQLAQDSKQAVLMLALANLLADVPENSDPAARPRFAAMLETLELGADTLAEIMKNAGQQCADGKSLILG